MSKRRKVNMDLCGTGTLYGRNMRAMVSSVLRMSGIVAVVLYELLELSFGLM